MRPGKDDKILTSWNGLMIEALANAGSALAEPKYLEAARRAAQFLLDHLRDDSGRLLHTYRHGQAKLAGYLDDYAYVAAWLFALYEATFETAWLDESIGLVEEALRHFYDDEEGGFFYTADDHEALIARNKDYYDQSIPSGNGSMALVLGKLGTLLGKDEYLEKARETIDSAGDILAQHPLAATQLLIAHDFLSSGTRQIVITAPAEDEELADSLRKIHAQYLPRAVFALTIDGQTDNEVLRPLVAGKPPVDNQVTVYACENFACQAPVSAQVYLEQLAGV